MPMIFFPFTGGAPGPETWKDEDLFSWPHNRQLLYIVWPCPFIQWLWSSIGRIEACYRVFVGTLVGILVLHRVTYDLGRPFTMYIQFFASNELLFKHF
jgi:hypothetical protein